GRQPDRRDNRRRGHVPHVRRHRRRLRPQRAGDRAGERGGADVRATRKDQLPMNTSTASRDEEMVVWAGRATMYALLAHGFAPPLPSRWRVVRESLLPAVTSLLI